MVRPTSFQRKLGSVETTTGGQGETPSQSPQNGREVHQVVEEETTFILETSMCVLDQLGKCTNSSALHQRFAACDCKGHHFG
jgi:hypothetical protein